MRPTWVFTVASETNSRPAISALDRPAAIWMRTSRSRSVRDPSAAGGGGSSDSSGTNRSSSRRVVDGATTRSPECTERIANSSSWGGTSFSRNPLAPALSAANAYSSRSNVVSISTRGDSPAAQIRRAASTPSSRGIRTSITITSASPRAARSTAPCPSAASPVTVMSGCASIIIRKPARTSSWSSTSTTRITPPPSSAGRGADPARPARPVLSRRTGRQPGRRPAGSPSPGSRRKAEGRR